MKRIALIVAIFTGFGFTHGMAQNEMKKLTKKLSCGINAEGNVSNFIMSGMPDAKSKMRIGTSFGAFVKFDITEHFAIQEDVFCLYKTSTLKQESNKSRYEFGGIEIPIYAMGQWNKKVDERFYVGIGPYAEWGLNAIYKTGGMEIELYKKDKATNKAYMTKLSMGIAVIIGYEFKDGTQVNAGYKKSLTNALEEGKDKSSMYSNILSLGVAYRFKSVRL